MENTKTNTVIDPAKAEEIKQKLETIMKKLEMNGQEKLNELKKSEIAGTEDTTIPLTDKLMDIMKGGASEFEKTMGRRMTYGEMREMYG
jgi:hypothetical protein